MRETAFLDKGMEGWTRKFLSRQLWRVEGTYEFDDLLSEAWLVLDKVSRKYTDVTEKHLMSLYQRSLSNRMHDLANEVTRKSFVHNGYSTNIDDDNSLDQLPAPRSIADSKTLENIVNGGDVVVACFVAVTTGKITAETGDSGKESHNDRFDRCLGLQKGANSARHFRDYLRESA